MHEHTSNKPVRRRTVQKVRKFLTPHRAKTPISIAILGLMGALFLLGPLPGGSPLVKFVDVAENIGEYFAYAFGFFILFWVILNSVISGRKLTKKRWPKLQQVFSEAIFSLTTQFIFIAVIMWITYLVTDGRIEANAYSELNFLGVPYFVLTVLLVFFVHDTFFYWFHRFMHMKSMYRWIHKTHHESRDPTPFTTFHFHPVEAILEAIAGKATIIIFLLIPYHESLPAIWVTGMILFNSIGHLGFEIYPSWWHKIPIISGKTTAMHHYMHHQRVGGNYALYFRFWDRLCKTEFSDYEQRYDAMFDNIKARKVAACK